MQRLLKFVSAIAMLFILSFGGLIEPQANVVNAETSIQQSCTPWDTYRTEYGACIGGKTVVKYYQQRACTETGLEYQVVNSTVPGCLAG